VCPRFFASWGRALALAKKGKFRFENLTAACYLANKNGEKEKKCKK
jgi:hypothetical protein